MSELIRREDAINAMAELQGIAQSKAELTGISKAWKKIKALPAAPRWHRVEEELPKLPDKDYCHVWCVGWFEGQKGSVPMEYGRILKRGKREERWLLYDRISFPPTKWAYLPEPPKEDA